MRVPTSGNRDRGTIQTPPQVTGKIDIPGIAQDSIDKVKKKLEELFGDGTSGNSNNSNREAKKEVEKIIKQAANLDVSSAVTVDNGTAKLNVMAEQFTSVFESIKELSKQANQLLKGKDPNASLLRVVATINLGKVDADYLQIR